MSSTEKVLRARIQLVDNFTNISNKVAKSVTNLGKTFNEANKKLDKLIETSKSPIVVKARDLASKIVNKVSNTLNKIKNIVLTPIIKVKDLATGIISKIKNKFDSLLSTIKKFTAPIVIKVKDMATKVIAGIKNSLLAIVAFNRILAKPIVISVKNMATKVITTVKAQIDKFKNSKLGQFVLKAKDMATKVISKVTSKVKSFASKAWKTTVAIKDKASSILSSIKGKLSSLAAGITIGVAVKSAVGGAMDLQQNQTSIRHFMGVGNAGKDKNALDSMANDYSSWLVNNANLTPFSTAEVMAGGAKALTATGGNVAKAQQMIKRAEDMEGLMGKPLEQAIDALMDIELGQYARLTEFGISAEGGEKGDSPEEVLKEIDRRFGGGAEKLSQSAKGKLSTMTGKFMSGLSQVGTVFLPGLSTAFDSISGLIDSVTPKMVEMADNLLLFYEHIRESGELSQYLQIFKTVGETAFNAIKAVIEACRPTVEAIFTFIGQHSTEISTIIQMLGTIWSSVWKTVGVLLKSAWGICSPILSLLLGALSKVSGAVEAICNAWNRMVNLLKTPINAVVNVAQKGISAVGNALGLSSGRNAFGSGRIARDGTLRTLHEGNFFAPCYRNVA